MPNTISPNMSLILPTVGQEPGPNWALDLNSSLSILDQHNHASGNGVQIQPSGLNINSDLTFNGNSAINLKATYFSPQGSALASSELRAVYSYNGDLYYNNSTGAAVQITNGAAVAGTPGSIGSLVSPASVNYVSGTQTYVFQSAVNTAGNIDAGSLTIRRIVASSNGITLSAPSSLPSNYTITFPSNVPSAQKIMSLDSSGNLYADYVVDNSTIEIASNIIQVKDLGITTAKLADSAVTTLKIADLNVTTNKLADSAVTTVKIADQSVTPVKRTPANEYTFNTGTVSATVTSTSTVFFSKVFTASRRFKQYLLLFQPYLSVSNINAGAQIRLFMVVVSPAVPVTGDIVNGSNIITNMTATDTFQVGQIVNGAGIPLNSTVSTINSDTSITINNNCTATSTGITITPTAVNTTIRSEDLVSGRPQFQALYACPSAGSYTLEIRIEKTSGGSTGCNMVDYVLQMNELG